MQDSHYLIERIKSMNQLLPTLDIMTIRDKEYFPSAICWNCNKEKEENFEHLFECESLEDDWNKVIEDMLEATSKTLREEIEEGSCEVREIRRAIFGTEKAEEYQRRRELAQGLVEKNIRQNLTVLYEAGKGISKAIKELVSNATKGFLNIIWPKRCEKMKENNANEETYKNYRKRKRKEAANSTAPGSAPLKKRKEKPNEEEDIPAQTKLKKGSPSQEEEKNKDKEKKKNERKQNMAERAKEITSLVVESIRESFMKIVPDSWWG
jgi:hypothetical protein